MKRQTTTVTLSPCTLPLSISPLHVNTDCVPDFIPPRSSATHARHAYPTDVYIGKTAEITKVIRRQATKKANRPRHPINNAVSKPIGRITRSMANKPSIAAVLSCLDKHDTESNTKTEHGAKRPPTVDSSAPGKLYTTDHTRKSMPTDALELDEHFKLNEPRALGVKLPTNKARTLWEWVTYDSSGTALDWTDKNAVLKANRWRQQKIRRRNRAMGIKEDGRKGQL